MYQVPGRVYSNSPRFYKSIICVIPTLVLFFLAANKKNVSSCVFCLCAARKNPSGPPFSSCLCRHIIFFTQGTTCTLPKRTATWS